MWLFNSRVEYSTVGDFFHTLNGTEHGSPPPLTTRDRGHGSRPRSKNHARGFEPGTSDSAVRHCTNSTTGWATPQSVTVPSLPRAGLLRSPSLYQLYHGLGYSAVRHCNNSTTVCVTPQTVTVPTLPRAGLPSITFLTQMEMGSITLL